MNASQCEDFTNVKVIAVIPGAAGLSDVSSPSRYGLKIGGDR